MASAPAFVRELYTRRSVLSQLVSQHLILRYRRTALGYLWTLVNPLLMMSVMALVFAALFKAELKSFVVFLFAAMIPWNFFNAVVTQSTVSLIHNEGLIKKIYLPKMLFPLSIALALLVDSVLSFVALFAIILTLGGTLTWTLLFLPVAYLMLFLFALGVGLMVSVATVFFRDLQHVILIAMQGLFFLTPVFYKPEAISGEIAWLVNLNPVTPFIELFRSPLYRGELPSKGLIFQALALSLSAGVVGLFVFLRNEKKIVFRL